MRKLCRVVKTTTATLSVPVVDEQGTAAWVDEGQEIPESDSTFGDVLFTSHQLSCLTLVSQELLQDSAFDMEAYLTAELCERMRWCEEEAFIAGDGHGKPTGFLETSSVAKTTPGLLVNFDAISDLYQALKPP